MHKLMYTEHASTPFGFQPSLQSHAPPATVSCHKDLNQNFETAIAMAWASLWLMLTSTPFMPTLLAAALASPYNCTLVSFL